MRSRFVSIAVVALAALVVFGARSARAGHPLGTEDPGTVAPKSAGVEFTIERSSYANRAESVIGVSVTTGLSGSVDAKVGAAYLLLEPDGGESQDGLGDVELALKWNLLAAPEGGRGLALKGTVTIPTGDDERGLGSGDYDLAVSAIAAFTLAPVELYVNVGYAFLASADQVAGEKEGVWSASAAAQWTVGDRFSLVGEVLAKSAGSAGDDPYLAALAGVIYTVSDGLSVDLGARIGLTDESPKNSVLAGVNLAFGGDGTAAPPAAVPAR